jgi:hypothetical protein
LYLVVASLSSCLVVWLLLVNMSTFHFSATAPSEQVLTDIGKLNALTDEMVGEVAHIVIGFLAGRTPNVAEAVEAFAASHSMQYERLAASVKALLFFFRHCINLSLAAKAIAEDLLAFGRVSLVALSCSLVVLSFSPVVLSACSGARKGVGHLSSMEG